MSNIIKLKRGSGSDPSASDLVVGEVALRTDSGKLFTKKDNGNVAEIGGSGISDGDKVKLQLYLDFKEFCRHIEQLGVNSSSIKGISQLKVLTEEAESLSQNGSS